MPDREKVIRAVETCFDSWIDRHYNLGLELENVRLMKNEALTLLKSQPEIVRCWQCRRNNECNIQFKFASADNPGDWYCAYGERSNK